MCPMGFISFTYLRGKSTVQMEGIPLQPILFLYRHSGRARDKQVAKRHPPVDEVAAPRQDTSILDDPYQGLGRHIASLERLDKGQLAQNIQEIVTVQMLQSQTGYANHKETILHHVY